MFGLPKKKKVVHFWNICGIGGYLSRYLDRWCNYESVAVDRGHANIYSHNNEKTLIWDYPAAIWLTRCMMFSRKFDIIHVHSGIQWLKWFRLFNPKKKILIHLHGTKIRGRWDEWEDLKFADQIIVSTPDLLEGSPEGTVYLPNPVDEELIHVIKESMKDIPKIPKAFHVDRYAVDVAKKYADQYGLELVVFDRMKTPLPHDKFLEEVAKYEYYINVERSGYLAALAEHEYYIDVKRDYPDHLYSDKVLEAMSLTGIEALALGCKVIDWGGRLLEEFPERNESYWIACQLNAIYEGLFDE